MVHLEPVLGLLLGVVAADGQAVHHLGRRGEELDVVDGAGLRVQAPPHHTLDEHVVRHVQQQEHVRGDAHSLDGVGLGCRARVPIQQPALLLGLGRVERVLHHGHHHLVGHQVAAVHEVLSAQPRGGARLDLRAQQVARADVRQAELLHDELALRALAAGRRARDDDALGRRRRRGHAHALAGGGGAGHLAGGELAGPAAGELRGGGGGRRGESEGCHLSRRREGR
mmetsp:Transcript_39161/g.97009  ORF Transcript_39161/g.97009 Transcript_39161/m.97009 type:complete len:226 (+) Transcript_39161:200-877(+)